MAARKKRDYIRICGGTFFLIVAVVSFLYANTGFFRPQSNAVTDHYFDFIDCGQGDSCLMVSEGSAALIDASTASESEQVIAWLKKRGVEKLDYLILTHPHEDHIGGAAAVLNEFEVDTVYMRQPTEGTEPTTSVYLNLLEELAAQSVDLEQAEAGDRFTCGAFYISILGPLKDYEDLNDQSLVLRVEHGENAFLFTGDQENAAEEDLVTAYGAELNSTLLKVGHHGSSSSSSLSFLEAVDPEYAVISCGADNPYGHPHRETLARMESLDISYYRTDLQGTVTVYSDGSKLYVQEEIA